MKSYHSPIQSTNAYLFQESLSSPSSGYLIGWSHGKETLKTGSYDTLKGSYYVNCSFYQGLVAEKTHGSKLLGYTDPNIWPRESLLPGFRQTFEELCTIIIDTAVLVARACDRYATVHVHDYEPGYLEQIVRTSTTTKARLLHYFPPEISKILTLADDASAPITHPHELKELVDDARELGSWCTTHLDHGCLTGLTSALYIDESDHLPSLSDSHEQTDFLPSLHPLSSPPSHSTGLYILSRTSRITKVTVPPDCIAFQTGEALELITGGVFRAVPHFVCVGNWKDGRRIARNTLAVFTQPGLDVIVKKESKTTFGEFCQEIAARFKQEDS